MENESPKPVKEGPGNRGLDIASWTLLAAASVVSAWCAYQSSLWNSVQTLALARASAAQFAAMRKSAVVNRNVSLDVGTILTFIPAYTHGDERVTSFLREHARPEFKPAFRAWIADLDSGRPDVPNPFARKEYRLAEQEEIAALDTEVTRNVSTSSAANRNSDNYVLHTVLFALALFFLGATSQTQRHRTRIVMLAIGVTAFGLTVLSMSRLPRAPSHLQHHADHPE